MLNTFLNWSIFWIISGLLLKGNSRDSSRRGISINTVCLILVAGVECAYARPRRLLDTTGGLRESQHFYEPNRELQLDQFTFDLDLTQLEAQEEQLLREKKSIPAAKNFPRKDVRKKLRQLVTNITETLNDMDYYFGREPSDEYTTEGTRRHLKKVRKTPRKSKEDTNHLLDSFIKQIYELEPEAIQKLRSRIDDEFSENKRSVRLAESELKKTNKASEITERNEFKEKRRSLVKSVMLKEKCPEYNENDDYEDFESGTKTYINLPTQSWTSTKSTPSTTFENFYDYGDYYKDQEELGAEERGDGSEIGEYDINQRVEAEDSTMDTEDFKSTKSIPAKRQLVRKENIKNFRRSKEKKKQI